MDDQSSSHEESKPRVIRPEVIELIDPRQEGVWAEQPVQQPLRPRRPSRTPFVLFFLTCASTYYVGGPAYTASLMLILLAHEFGHYLQARRHHVPATLPYFIPFPIPPIGTMGAVILQGAGVANRRQLYDIAISGPLAGLVIAIPIMYFGLQQSTIGMIDPNAAGGFVFGEPLLLQWMIASVHGPLAEGQDVMMSPMLHAGWVGIFITALNLMPIGQLDGGHILYTLIGKRAHRVAMGLVLFAFAYMIFSGNPSYALMLMLIVFMGAKHPPTANDSVPLDTGRTVLGWLTLAFIFIGFTPTPLIITQPPEQPPADQPKAPVQAQVEIKTEPSTKLVTAQPSTRDFMNRSAFSAK
jgi:Zn-dependent protease